MERWCFALSAANKYKATQQGFAFPVELRFQIPRFQIHPQKEIRELLKLLKLLRKPLPDLSRYESNNWGKPLFLS